MKRYISHKTVEAGVIQELGSNRVKVDDEWIEVPDGIFSRGTPVEGQDYLVVYSDGYIAWSPKAPFEEGYNAE